MQSAQIFVRDVQKYLPSNLTRTEEWHRIFLDAIYDKKAIAAYRREFGLFLFMSLKSPEALISVFPYIAASKELFSELNTQLDLKLNDDVLKAWKDRSDYVKFDGKLTDIIKKFPTTSAQGFLHALLGKETDNFISILEVTQQDEKLYMPLNRSFDEDLIAEMVVIFNAKKLFRNPLDISDVSISFETLIDGITTESELKAAFEKQARELTNFNWSVSYHKCDYFSEETGECYREAVPHGLACPRHFHLNIKFYDSLNAASVENPPLLKMCKGLVIELLTPKFGLNHRRQDRLAEAELQFIQEIELVPQILDNLEKIYEGFIKKDDKTFYKKKLAEVLGETQKSLLIQAVRAHDIMMSSHFQIGVKSFWKNNVSTFGFNKWSDFTPKIALLCSHQLGLNEYKAFEKLQEKPNYSEKYVESNIPGPKMLSFKNDEGHSRDADEKFASFPAIGSVDSMQPIWCAPTGLDITSSKTKVVWVNFEQRFTHCQPKKAGTQFDPSLKSDKEFYSPYHFSYMSSVDISDPEKPEQVKLADWNLTDEYCNKIDSDWMESKLVNLNRKKTKINQLFQALKHQEKERLLKNRTPQEHHDAIWRITADKSILWTELDMILLANTLAKQGILLIYFTSSQKTIERMMRLTWAFHKNLPPELFEGSDYASEYLRAHDLKRDFRCMASYMETELVFSCPRPTQDENLIWEPQVDTTVRTPAQEDWYNTLFKPIQINTHFLSITIINKFGLEAVSELLVPV